jgi:hypothetical protein
MLPPRSPPAGGNNCVGEVAIRDRVIGEIITTERSFVANLQVREKRYCTILRS